MAISSDCDSVIEFIFGQSNEESLISPLKSVFPADFADSICEFDLSLLNSADDNQLSVETLSGNSEESVSVESLPIVSKIDSLSRRVGKLEELLGLFQIAFWKVKADRAVRVIVNLCQNKMGLAVSEQDFSVVQRLDSRRKGVLLQVSSAEFVTRSFS